MQKIKDVQHVFLVGSKSLGAYGGYETFVNKLTEYHQNNEKIKYHVACKANGDGYMDETKADGVTRISDTEFSYHNARCFKIHVPNMGPAQAIYYDIAALHECCKYIKEHKIPHPIVYIMACRIGPVVGYYRNEIHKLGGKIYLNPDGHEWMRGKWSAPIRWYWKVSEQMMVKHCDLAICDSVNIEKYIHECYDGKGIKGTDPATNFIAYGAETRKSQLNDDDPKLLDWYKQKGLTAKGYYLVVGRFVPENNYETMIREYMKSKSDRDFAIITNVNDKFQEGLEKRLHFKSDKRIKFVGTVYDQELLMKIRENAYGYFHGHEVGGTNPSLLEALGSTDLNLLLGVGFNREVAEEAAIYWSKDDGNLAALIDKADQMSEEEIKAMGFKAKNRIAETYSWQFICDRYADTFLHDVKLDKPISDLEWRKTRDLEATHKNLLRLMVVFDDICQKNNVHYTLHGGTLLGGIREHGFIPWDDDADIAITRTEYEKLALVLSNDYEEYHVVGNIKKQFRMIGDEDSWVDIFICDYISENKMTQKLKQFVLTALDIMNRDKNSIRLSNISKFSKFKQSIFKILFYIGQIVPSKAKVNLYSKVSRDMWLGSKNTYFRSNDQYLGRRKVFPVEWLKGYQHVPFEDSSLLVSTEFHSILVSCYGENYMIPIKEDRNAAVHNLIRTEGEIKL